MGICPGQDIKRFISRARLDNRNTFCTPSPRTEYFERFFFN